LVDLVPRPVQYPVRPRALGILVNMPIIELAPERSHV
jgi:hypothetical protein